MSGAGYTRLLEGGGGGRVPQGKGLIVVPTKAL